MSLAPERLSIGLERRFTSPEQHPFDQIAWERRDARITNWKDGSVAFEQLGVEFPVGWSLNATNIVAQKYFRGTLGTPERETSLRQVIDRVADTITAWGIEGGYFVDDTEAETFRDELKFILVTQRAAFNSPVWFNIGVKGVPQQASACFILSVDDTMDGILNWYREEGVIFKGGSGSGVNLSKIRSSYELLNGGGTASGPVSFMRGADASAGTIKSGGKTRRAAKMVILDVDHPDVEEFIWCKVKEERKARVLRDAGFDMDLDGSDSFSIQYQNANNSVRVSDEFMQAVLDDADWHYRAVIDGSIVRTVRARDLWRQIAQASWECADPGLQFDTTINKWHTAHATGRINGSNPCSEYMHLDNSACNLASINLLKYLDLDSVGDDSFDIQAYMHTVEVIFTAQEILVGRADYPTERIADTSRKFRQLGIGYANLGALLMALGLPYDSTEGRAWAAALTSLMTGHAYATSARTASRMGPFAGFADNEVYMLNVLRMHRDASYEIEGSRAVPPALVAAGQQAWDAAVRDGEEYGVRNSQASVLAPTGCLVGGSLVNTSNGLVRLRSLGDPDGAQWQDVSFSVQTDEGVQEATQFYVNGLEQVVDVTTLRGYQIQGTTKHRIKVVDQSGAWSWRRFADLRTGDRVPMALGGMVGTANEVVLPPLSDKMAWAGEHHVRVPSTMNADLAELVGYFMGDGSLHSRGLRFCVDAHDLDVVSHLQWLGKELFGIEAATAQRGGYIEVSFHSVRLVEWWVASGFAKRLPHEGHSGKGYTPYIPDAVLHTNDPECYRSFVRGLFEADGTVTSGYPSWTTTSPGFAGEVQTLLLALGFVTTRSQGVSGRGSKLQIVRLLNRLSNQRWLTDVGFISQRKWLKVDVSDAIQAARYDHIPVTRQLIDRVVPQNDRDRKVALMEYRRSASITRRLADELFQRSGDPELGHLLGFFFDEIQSAVLGDEELTYDLSVPANVTYVANGFVSHNTIGLMMDCDTTGIEPDLGLCKMKKLVGGGTMVIVNQTIPRALRRLGYSPQQVDEIIAYIDHEKSILGAPHLAAEHVPVFACSMGDNTIHYEGHVRMMGATQPFLSGAISKTVNMPEDASVEDIELLHQLSWELGLKAVAIYRDNCKVAQPLSNAKKGDKTDAEAAAEVVVEKIVEKIVHQPIRQKLPRTRSARTFEFRVADCKGFANIGEYADGRPGEIFLTVSKQGSTLSGIMDAFAKSISYGLQYGVPLRAFVEAFTNMRFEPAGMTDDPDIRFASSIMDYLFRRLALEYMTYDERAELSIFSVDERLQPTLPGVEESVMQTFNGSELATDPKSIPSAAELATQLDLGVAPQAPNNDVTNPAGVVRSAPGGGNAKPVVRQSDAPMCMQCGVQMIRAGSCHACPSCGSTSGCS
jgi:ribonucleoside-diphosphate reductase alpha chain